MDQAVTYQVEIEYSTVPTRYDLTVGDQKIHWEDYADARRAPREAHSDQLEFVSPAPSEAVGEGGVIEEEAVLKQLRIQICEHLDRVCPEGYDLDSFTARLAEEQE